MQARVKICGITNVGDALAAVNAGADAIGFVFYEKSPRHLTPEQAAKIIRDLPPFVSRVGLFVDASAEEVHRAIETSGIDTVQLHGDESPDFCSQFRLPVLKAIRVRSVESLRNLQGYPVSALLLDSFVPGKHGGTGSKFDWGLAIKAKGLGKPVILAGGLNPSNVAEAVSQVNPYAVDVSSGVESSPGKKDMRKLHDFILAAKGHQIR